MKKYLSFLLFFLICINLHAKNPIDGKWRGELRLNDSTIVPFRFNLSANEFRMFNKQDTFASKELIQDGDSITIRLAIFGTELHFKKDSVLLKGYFKNTTRANPSYVPFSATRESYLFYDKPEKASVNFTGRYDVYFQSEDSESTHAVGIFDQSGNYISGTFLTTTGDYRFLEGDVTGDKMLVSTFDGSHVFFFSARMKKDSLVDGTYYSSISWFDQWKGIRNPNAVMASAEGFIKYDSTPLKFSFKNSDGKIVSLDDSAYLNKPVIIQLMGSWCPNCMDETKFLSPWFKNKSNDVQVVALDFERISDTLRINQAIKRIEKQLSVTYPVLYAGSSDKKIAVKSFPQLNRLFAFPTLLFLNRNKQIVASHSGFSGPATGKEYDDFIRWFNKTVSEISR
jgi:thiol-disulfide isomerase/thioredoxin